ncbi:MAG: DUF4332 domain-containing protein [Chloroflexi bacterium]|nr:MAG: DUF4332 domain-containing protein [Chloroflexota bacterium]TME17489.1 MAG: DUF4332 domain-containing protein [Chloroflexota bacterium]TME19578.1 MAG: DUF4332 domain-containing protein [Chloroflexota bacterium]
MPMKRLEYIRGISPEECERLRAVDVQHTNQLLHFTTLVIDRERLALRTGIPEERLKALGQEAALMEVSGSERFLSTLQRCGITSLAILAREDAPTLHQRLVNIVGMSGAPTLSDVEYWISQARTIDVIEEPDEEHTRAERLRSWRSR